MKRGFTNSFVRIFLIVFFIWGLSGCNRKQGPVIGIKIYEFSGDPSGLMDRWKSMGINTAFIGKELSRRSEFVECLRKNKIPFFIIWPVFQNEVALRLDSSLEAILDDGRIAREDWVKFVCPSRKTYRRQQIDSISWYMEHIKPDGISIDFIRQFVFWEMIYPEDMAGPVHNACYCDSCISQFLMEERISGLGAAVTVSQKAVLLNGELHEKWDRFRCRQISSMVKEIHDAVKKINPEIKINLHIVPWREMDFNHAIIHIAAQDIKDMSEYADFVSPMCYSQMLKRNSGWILSVVNDMNKKAPGKILPSIQVYPYYIGNDFPPDSLRECLAESMKYPSNGAILWSWPLLEKDSLRIRVISGFVGDLK